jgi:hypothetical protein
MRIAIVGSWRMRDKQRWKLSRSRDEFTAACVAIGHELALKKQTVIVGGEDPETADCHVVGGVIEKAGGTKRLIEVIRIGADNQSFGKQADSHPGLFTFPEVGDIPEESTEKRAVRGMIGGKNGTYLGGLTASLAGKKLAPIGDFGGASRDLLKARLKAAKMSGHHEELSKLETLNSPWSQEVLHAALDVIGVDRSLRILIIYGRSDDRQELSMWLEKEHKVTPIMLDVGSGGAITIAEDFEDKASAADAAIALVTPADVGSYANEPLVPRARQNVWLEFGWIWSRLGRDKILVLCKKVQGAQNVVEIPSDLGGIKYLEYENTPTTNVGSGISEFVRRIQKKI